MALPDVIHRTNLDSIVYYDNKARYYKGPRGVGVYTAIDTEGNYGVYFYRPAGKGARQGLPAQYKRVPRLDTKRKSKIKAIDRAYAMAYGTTRREKSHRDKIITEPFKVGYCLKQRKYVNLNQWSQTTAKNGRLMLVSPCPECSTLITKYGKLVDCPECGERRPGKTNDYLCVFCRAAQ